MPSSKTYNAANDYTEVTADADFDSATTTAVTWATMSVHDDNFRGVFTKDLFPNDGSWYLGKSDVATLPVDNGFILNVNNSSAGSQGTKPAVDIWVHIAAAIASTNIQLYQDGTNPDGTNVNVYTASNTNVVIGARKNGGAFDEQWKGSAAFSAVYNRKLTQAEINEVRWNPFSIVNGLKGFWYGMDGLTTEIDRSGNGHDGTVTGAANSVSGPPVFLLGGQ